MDVRVVCEAGGGAEEWVVRLWAAESRRACRAVERGSVKGRSRPFTPAPLLASLAVASSRLSPTPELHAAAARLLFSLPAAHRYLRAARGAGEIIVPPSNDLNFSHPLGRAMLLAYAHEYAGDMVSRSVTRLHMRICTHAYTQARTHT